ncbi:rho GTPase-activating protein gacU [Rhagoletis pomonella]|uniref:rho GTPase-activating protein gacU n=1 Tax=Rhagoletis pomonella TaxID=28610 RepID=UPI00177D9C6E|nr:rho GTPase-activating protein gacU [Rhagoletis pomonella]
MDAKPRELYLLFRAYEGYEGSLLKVTSKNGKTASPVGFVTFHTRAGAEAAKQDLQQGVRFDPDMPQTIRLEFAKSNTKVSKPKPQPNTATTASHPALMHPLTGHLGGPFFPGGPELWHHPLAYSAAAAELPGAAALQHATLVHPALHPQVPVPMHMSTAAAATGPPGPPPTGHTAHHHFLSSPALASPVGSSNNPSHPSNPPLAANAPCSTLFVANLGQFVSEHELKEVFSSMPGFCRLRMHTKGSHNFTSTTSTTTTSTITNVTNTSTTSTDSNAAAIANYPGPNNINYNNTISSNNNSSGSNASHPVAFIEFKDTVSAATAMQQLQGKYLLSSDRGSIRIEFAKTKMINDTSACGGIAKHNNNHSITNNQNNDALAMEKAANAMNATQMLTAGNMATVAPAATAMTLITSNQQQLQPQPQLIILNGYPQHQQQQQQLLQQQQQTSNQAQQQQQAMLQSATLVQQHAMLPQHFIAANGATAAAVAYPAPIGSSLATIFTSTNSTNNTSTTSTTNLNNNNISMNNNNNNSNNIVHNRSTALPPTVVVNSLQHQLHPTQHQNHLFRDRSGYGIKA